MFTSSAVPNLGAMCHPGTPYVTPTSRRRNTSMIRTLTQYIRIEILLPLILDTTFPVLLDSRPHALACPSESSHLSFMKFSLDPLASRISAQILARMLHLK